MSKQEVSLIVSMAFLGLSFMAVAIAQSGPVEPEIRIAAEIEIGSRPLSTRSLPNAIILREKLGIACTAALDGQVVHRSRKDTLFETRAVITPKGDFLLMFPEGGHYGGKREKVNDLIAYRSSDKGRTWQGPTVAFDIPYSQHGFVPLIPKGTARIYAFGTQPIYERRVMERGLRENAPIGYRYSDDDGRTWSEVRLISPVNDRQFTGMSVMRMCETSAGTWLIGSHEGDWSVKPLRTRLYVLRSENRGRTWALLPDKRPNGWYAKGWDRMDEGRPVDLGGGNVMFMMRTPEGHLWATWSHDDGRTWEEPRPTSLVHPDAPPMLFHLSDGKTLAAFHHNRHSNRKYEGLNTSPQVMKDRSEIWVSFSGDGGRSWSEPRFVFANAAEANLTNAFRNYQCSYLDAILEGGMVHLFVPHRWQRVLHLHIKEEELKRLPTERELFPGSRVSTP
jgi:hypothetical protein